MARPRLLVLALLAAFAFAGPQGCASLSRDIQLTSDFAGEGSAYGRALSRYTRKAELYQGLDTVAKAWATWRAPPLRRALAEASIQAYGLKGDDAETLRHEQERAGRRAREFHVSLYTPQKGWNDLESPDSLWRSFVELPGGGRMAPHQVIHLPKDDRSAVEHPYVSPWTREYTLLFPLLEGEETREHLILIVTGPLGTMRFEY